MSDLYDKYPIPENFPEIIHDLTKEMVIRQPKDIYDFAYEYFKSKENNSIFNYPFGSWQIIQEQNQNDNKYENEIINKDIKIENNCENKNEDNLSNLEQKEENILFENNNINDFKQDNNFNTIENNNINNKNTIEIKKDLDNIKMTFKMKIKIIK